jgi:hypothetical protein
MTWQVIGGSSVWRFKVIHHLRSDSLSFHPVHSLIVAIGSRILYYAMGIDRFQQNHSENQAIYIATVMGANLESLTIATVQFSHALQQSIANNITLAAAPAHQSMLYTIDFAFKHLPVLDLMVLI